MESKVRYAAYSLNWVKLLRRRVKDILLITLAKENLEGVVPMIGW